MAEFSWGMGVGTKQGSDGEDQNQSAAAGRWLTLLR